MASFTQKHYKTVAHVLKTNLDWPEIELTSSGNDHDDVNESYSTAAARCAVKGIALDFHNVFRMDNPRYDANKFMDACGIDDWKDITEPTEQDIQPYETPDFYGEQV
jgi:hypothetical protein